MEIVLIMARGRGQPGRPCCAPKGGRRGGVGSDRSTGRLVAELDDAVLAPLAVHAQLAVHQVDDVPVRALRVVDDVRQLREPDAGRAERGR